MLAQIVTLKAQQGSAEEDFRVFRQQLGVDGQQLSKALLTLEGQVEHAVGKQQMMDELHQVRVEMNRIEHDAIQAHQGLDQRVKGFEEARA